MWDEINAFVDIEEEPNYYESGDYDLDREEAHAYAEYQAELMEERKS